MVSMLGQRHSVLTITWALVVARLSITSFSMISFPIDKKVSLTTPSSGGAFTWSLFLQICHAVPL